MFFNWTFEQWALACAIYGSASDLDSAVDIVSSFNNDYGGDPDTSPGTAYLIDGKHVTAPRDYSAGRGTFAIGAKCGLTL